MRSVRVEHGSQGEQTGVHGHTEPGARRASSLMWDALRVDGLSDGPRPTFLPSRHDFCGCGDPLVLFAMVCGSTV